MNCSMPGSPVLHYLPEFAQTHVHWVGDAIQTSHPLSPPSPPALNLSRHQGLFQWINSSHKVAKVLELQHESFQWIFRIVYILDWHILAVRGTLKSLFQHHNSKAPIGAQPSLWFNSHIHTCLLIIREMQINTTIRCHLSLIRMTIKSPHTRMMEGVWRKGKPLTWLVEL